MYLDHANIVTSDLDAAVDFFTEVLGLTAGPRPNFRVPGYWLYSDSRPLIHLTQATTGVHAGKSSTRIDHIALRVAAPPEWSALLARLKYYQIDYQLGARADDRDTQLWVALTPNVTIEFIMAH